MKRNQNDSKGELFFKNLASSYAEQSGNELKKELEKLNNSNPSTQSTQTTQQNQSSQSEDIFLLDKKINNIIRTEKIKKWTVRLLPLAICFILVITYNVMPIYNILGYTVRETPSKILTYEFINAKLPPDYTLQKIDYDRQKAIYYISTNKDGEIILTVEEFKGNIQNEGLEEISIGDTTAYGISKEDYSFIQYKKDNFLYTLTSPHDYYGLIILSKSLI